MALDITDSIITSDITPENARLLPIPPGEAWELSWLPTVALTREQAVNGMALDELLSDPGTADNDLALEVAALRAAELGISLRDVLLRLYLRIAERDQDSARQPHTPIPAA
ncbi:hypothetical protein [Nocardia pneumoniae]|uniref:hypothetical protein n=1 Tax=Nocardia pneumoniae TaxID=228601 RepID=UPI000316A269|nr:hypothetical protein [Nocardia pneumoniae]